MADNLKIRLRRLPGKAWEKAKRAFWGRFFIDDHSDKPVVFISGSGRSGTTWLSNIINFKNQYRYIFEPFHPKWATQPDFFVEYKYLALDDDSKDYYQFIDGVIHGRVNNHYSNRLNRKLVANKRLIKDIHSNLMLKWIKVNFPQTQIILLMRHPLSVVKSRYELKWGARNWFINDKDLMRDFPQIGQICEEFTDEFDRYILKWCIESYVPLTQLGPEEAHVVFYEDLCEHPELQTQELFDYLGMDYDEMAKKAIEKPSAVSRKGSAIHTGGNMIEGYRKHFSSEQIDRAMLILQRFGLDRIYGADPMPLVNGSKALEILD